MNSLPANNMKFGIVIAREFGEFNNSNLPTLIEELTRLGCQTHNIVLRDVPTVHDFLIGTSLFAQYTDVDGVILFAPSNRVLGNLALMNGIVGLQVQWNMVVEIGGAECAEHIVDMITLQNEMESTAEVHKTRHNFS